MCDDINTSGFNYTIDKAASQWAYEFFKDKDMRMLFYSGDKDSVVPTIGTMQWIHQMGWPVTKDWNYYQTSNKQVAGYYEERGNFTFATIHGAGHLAPQDQNDRAYHIIFNWLNKRGEFKE